MSRSTPDALNQRKYSLAVYIGRFQPFHLGHLAVIIQALLFADTVMIVIGSARSARRFDYVPFRSEETEEMIRLALSAEQNSRVKFYYAEDQGSLPRWSGLVRRAANEIEPDNNKIALVGFRKDNSSFYLKSFPGWSSENVEGYTGTHGIVSATWFRERFINPDFSPDLSQWSDEDRARWTSGLHPTTHDWLIDFRNNNPDAYRYLIDESVDVAKTRAKYGPGPFMAVDTLIIQGDHFLAIRRGNHPFKGCIALPGGFVEIDEDVTEAAIREQQREEAKLKLSENTLRSSIIGVKDFSAPYRDPRGRIVSWLHIIHLKPRVPDSMTDPREIKKLLALPKVRAGDDAADAFWKLIASAKREEMAFDSYNMLQYAVELIGRLDAE